MAKQIIDSLFGGLLGHAVKGSIEKFQETGVFNVSVGVCFVGA